MSNRIPLSSDTRSLEQVYLDASLKCSTTNIQSNRVDVTEKSTSGSYLLPWSTAKPKRKKNEHAGRFLLRLLASEVIRFGMRYKGQNPSHQNAAMMIEMYIHALKVARTLETRFETELNGRTLRLDILWLSVERNLLPMALENFDRETYESMQQRAQKAGRAHKSYTLHYHLQTAHMNVSQAARHLGISRNSVYAMRREYQEIDVSTGELREEAEATPYNEPTQPNTSWHQTRAEVKSSPQSVEVHEPRRSTTPPSHAHRVGASGEDLAIMELPF